MSQSILERVIGRGHVVVGTGSDNVPWHFRDQDGKLAGFDVAMGRLLAKALFDDLEQVEFVIQSPDKRIANVLDDTVDITFQFMSYSAERARRIAFSVPYYTEGIGLILRAGDDRRTYEDLIKARDRGEKLNVAVLANPGADAEVHELLPGAAAIQVNETAMVYTAVAEGRADAGMADLSSIKWLASHQPDRYVDSGFSAHPQNYAAAMRPDDQQWINFVNGVLVDAMSGASHGDYDRAFEAYFGERLQAPPFGKPGMFRFA